MQGDSVIVGSYRNDVLHGKYRVYRDLNKLLFGQGIQTDTSKLILTTDGTYHEGHESGYWKNYDLSGALRSEGRYLEGEEVGEWKYYYTKWADPNGNTLPYSGEPYQVVNYSNGILDGKSTRYSFLEEEEYPCSEIDETRSPSDTCKRMVYRKVWETTYYKNGRLNGSYELRDSLNEVQVKGNFRDDVKEGEWMYRNNYKDDNGEIYSVYYKGNCVNDLREGKWIQYLKDGRVLATFNYKNNQLDGEYIEWNRFNKPLCVKQFKNGDLVELVSYDSAGVKPGKKFEIYDNTDSSYKCRFTLYDVLGASQSQEYWLTKNGEINHELFEVVFFISINKMVSGGITAYRDGEYRWYDADNKPLMTGRYYKDDKVGLWTTYYHEQKVSVQAEYAMGKEIYEIYYTTNGQLFSGEFVYYDEEKDIKELRKIKDGRRNGKTVYIDTKTKKTIKKENYKNGKLI
mgnify:CR=1 FL=1